MLLRKKNSCLRVYMCVCYGEIGAVAKEEQLFACVCVRVLWGDGSCCDRRIVVSVCRCYGEISVVAKKNSYLRVYVRVCYGEIGVVARKNSCLRVYVCACYGEIGVVAKEA